MLRPETWWVYLCFLAILFTGLRGFQRKRIASKLRHHQHIHLISTLTTTFLCVVVLALKRPEIPSNYIFFFVLCLVNGLGYALAGVCNYGAVRHLKLSTFQSVSKLSAFLPVVVFYFVLGEDVSRTQLIGILLAMFPLLMLAYVEPDEHGENGARRDVKRGVSFLLLYLLITSGMQIVNVIAVKDDVEYSLGADPFLFMMCTNALSLPYIMVMIVKSKEKVSLPSEYYKAGFLAGVVNTLAFGTLLLAVSMGPASTIIPLYAYNSFVSISLLKAFPVSSRSAITKKSVVITMFIVIWSLVSVWILVTGSLS